MGLKAAASKGGKNTGLFRMCSREMGTKYVRRKVNRVLSGEAQEPTEGKNMVQVRWRLQIGYSRGACDGGLSCLALNVAVYASSLTEKPRTMADSKGMCPKIRE